MSTAKDVDKNEQGSSLHAAMARTVTRSLAIYFSRPARLFRPSKVSGWTFLRDLALRQGVSLSPQYVSNIIKQQGVLVITRHFIPPIIINAVLGTVLWTTYAESALLLKRQIPHHPIAVACIAGSLAGGVQGLLAAPVENLRFILEGSSTHSNWSEAWKDVFQGTRSSPKSSPVQTRLEAKQVMEWMREVNSMAGRGWKGWAWGCGKDAMGFAVFFTVFEITRKVAKHLRKRSLRVVDRITQQGSKLENKLKAHLPRMVNGLTLVTGGIVAGLCYEITGRPWDVARRTMYSHAGNLSSGSASAEGTVLQVLTTKLKNDGLQSFFRDVSKAKDKGRATRTTMLLRMLGRLGPWGVGFLAWEAFGPGISV